MVVLKPRLTLKSNLPNQLSIRISDYDSRVAISVTVHGKNALAYRLGHEHSEWQLPDIDDARRRNCDISGLTKVLFVTPRDKSFSQNQVRLFQIIALEAEYLMECHIGEPHIALRIDRNAVRHVEPVGAPRMEQRPCLRIKHHYGVVSDGPIVTLEVAIVLCECSTGRSRTC